MSRDLRVNDAIRAREVRVVDSDGNQLGVMHVKDGLRLAQEKGLDLVEVAPKARPPVCRVMDYGKYKYEQAKKEREARKKQKTITVKEVRMSPKIEEHDFQVKVRNAERFINNGDKVKVSIRFRGREIVHNKLAKEMLLDLADRVKDIAVIDRPPKLEGRHMIMFLAPKNSK